MSYRMRLCIFEDAENELNDVGGWDVPKEKILYHEQIFSYVDLDFLVELGLDKEQLKEDEWSFDKCVIPFSSFKDVRKFKEWFTKVYKSIIREQSKESLLEMIYEDGEDHNIFWSSPYFSYLGSFGKVHYDIFIKVLDDCRERGISPKNLKAILHAG